MNGAKYTRRQIDTIIRSGSVEEKSLLFLRDRMGYNGTGFILDYDDIERLTLSIRRDERKEWEENIGFGLRLENGFKDLQSNLRELMNFRSRLVRILNEIQDFEKLEETLNRLLDPVENPLTEDVDLIDLSLRRINLDKIRERVPENQRFNLINLTLDEECNINLNLTGQGSLSEEAEQERERVKQALTFYLCYETAMRRRIKESRIQVPEYEERLRMNREILEQPISLRTRFVGVQDNKTYQVGECNLKDRNPQEYPFPSIRNLIEDYSVRTKDIDLTTEENQGQIEKCYKQI